MMKMKYNKNTGLYEYCDRLTGEGIFDIFTKVGSEVAKIAASEGAKIKNRKSRNTGTWSRNEKVRR